MNEQNHKSHQQSNLVLQDRKTLMLSGVCEIGSYDEQNVVAYTAAGSVQIKGAQLNITKLNIDDGQMHVEGQRVDSVVYSDKHKKGKRFLQQLLQ